MTRSITRRVALLAVLAGAACSGGDDSPTGPVAGTLNVVLTSPNSDDGAVMLQITGAVDSVVVPTGLTAWQSEPGANVLRAIVTGDLASGGTLLTLRVPDVSKASSYSTQVLQVSSETYAQRPVGGYSLSLQQ